MSSTERDATRRVQQRAYDMTLAQEREALLNRRLKAANAALLVTQRELEASREALVHLADGACPGCRARRLEQDP